MLLSYTGAKGLQFDKTENSWIHVIASISLTVLFPVQLFFALQAISLHMIVHISFLSTRLILALV